MKNKNETPTENPENGENKTDTKVYFYISIAACVLAAVAFGLSFSALGIYSLIASFLLEFCALSFATTQKKKNPFPAVKIATVTAYVLLGLSAALFIGGLIYSAAA